jgi:OOP family OmpA-OmpF porin
MNFAKLVIIAILAGPHMTVVQAEEFSGSNFYIGASGGEANYDISCSGASDCDDSDTGWKVFMGVDNNRFGFEAGYVNFGEPLSHDVWGVQMQGLGIHQFNDQFSAFAKAGGLAYDGDEIDNGFTWSLGAGVQYNFSGMFGVRAEYEWYYDIDDLDNTSLISAGLILNFD